MRLALAAAVALLASATSSLAAVEHPSFWATPAVQGFGKMHYERRFAYQPKTDQTYKIVFEVTKSSVDPTQLNSGLDHVARAVNLYVAAGVPLDHLHFVAVLEGDTATVSLSNDAYRARYHVDNPSLQLIRELRAKGVDVAVCAQAAALHDIDYATIDSSVTLSLSALTTVSTLEHDGYALIMQ